MSHPCVTSALAQLIQQSGWRNNLMNLLVNVREVFLMAEFLSVVEIGWKVDNFHAWKYPETLSVSVTSTKFPRQKLVHFKITVPLFLSLSN